MKPELIAWALSATLLATWAVALGGIASLQADCDDHDIGHLSGVLGVRGFSSNLSCKKVYRYYWFMIAFEFAIIFGLVVSLVAGWYRKTRVSWVGMFAVGTLLYIQATDSFLTTIGRPYFSDDTQEHRAKTVLAGYLMTAIVNGVTVGFLGWEYDAVADNQKAADTVQATAV